MAHNKNPLVPEARSGLNRLRDDLAEAMQQERHPYVSRFREIAETLVTVDHKLSSQKNSEEFLQDR